MIAQAHRRDHPSESAIAIAGALVVALAVIAVTPTAMCEEASDAAASESHKTLFAPLIADPKEPHFFAAVLPSRVDAVDRSATVGSVGFGDEFGVWEGVAGVAAQNRWRIGFQAGVMAQFLLDSASYPLLNADYVVGVPVTWRREHLSARVRVYHQSSHLGDEYLLQHPSVQRVDVSFEEIEGAAAIEVASGRGRAYVGAGLLLHRHPAMERGKLFGGFEWRARRHTWSIASNRFASGLVAAVEVKHLQELNWKPDLRMVLGMELTRGPGTRTVVILAEYDHGSFPYGQFFQEKGTQVGLGIHLGL